MEIINQSNFQNNKINQNLREEFFVEIPNFIKNNLMRSYHIINDIIKNLSNYNDMISKLEEYSKNDINTYKSVIAGLLYGILYDPVRSNDLIQNLVVINKDNFDFFLSTLISLIDSSHLNLTNQIYDQIILIFNKLIHMNCPKLVDLMVILLRIFFAGNWIHERIDLYKKFLSFLKSKINWIVSSPSPFLVGLTFTKILRLTTENHFLAVEISVYQEILADEVFILNKLWNCKKEGVLAIGRELIRNLIPISKSNIQEVKAIMEDISKLTSNEANPAYVSLLTSQHPFIGFNPFIHINIPPMMERMVVFILSEVKKSNYTKYISWVFKKFQITKDDSLLIDLSRYIVTCFHSFSRKSEITPRWLVLGYFLKFCKNDMISGEIKQAIFYDWLFYNKEKDNILLIEPGILVIFNSIREFTDMTMELIEFIDLYSDNFDQNQKNKIRNCVTDSFRQAETFQIVTSLKSILKEEKIHENVKKTFEILIKYNKEEESIIIDNTEENIIDSNECAGQSAKPSISHPVRSLTKGIENEFFIHPALDELINPITIKNFLNFKTKVIFKNLLDEICRQYVNKLKSQNLLESKLIKFQKSHLDINSSFANFYLNIFKDELISNINPYEIEIETENLSNANGSTQNKYVSFYLIDYMMAKFLEKNEKEFNLIVEFVKKIIENFPNYLVRVIYYICKKYTIPSKSKIINHKILFSIFCKIFDDNISTVKERVVGFFNTCIDYLDLDILNYFIENGFQIFNSIFMDESELLLNLITYSDNSSLNKIIIDITSNKYILIQKNLYKIISTSDSMEITDQDKLWGLILAHDNLNSMTNPKEFFKNMTSFSKNISLKNKPYLNISNEFFKNINNFIRIVFINDLSESNLVDYYLIFDFPCFYYENVYNILCILNKKLLTHQNSNRISSNFFSNLVNEYLNQLESNPDKFHFTENFLKLFKELIQLDRSTGKPILYDTHILNSLKIKLESLLKIFRIEIDL